MICAAAHIIYAQLNLHPVRASMEVATQAMWDAGRVRDKAEVVDLSEIEATK
jgi:hypothetical protein